MSSKTKQQELDELERRKQAILSGIDSSSSTDSKQPTMDELDKAQADATAYPASPAYPQLGQSDPLAQPPQYARQTPPAANYGSGSMYPEQDQYGAEIEQLRRRLAAMQGTPY